MRETKIIAVFLGICACVAASSVTAATIPAGTTLAVTTVSLITSQDAVGAVSRRRSLRTFRSRETFVLKAGTKAFGKSALLVANPRKSEPLAVELTSVS